MTRAANAAQARARPVDEQITRYLQRPSQQWLKGLDHWPGRGRASELYRRGRGPIVALAATLQL